MSLGFLGLHIRFLRHPQMFGSTLECSVPNETPTRSEAPNAQFEEEAQGL
jgi:hypothetical protein